MQINNYFCYCFVIGKILPLTSASLCLLNAYVASGCASWLVSVISSGE